MTWQLTPIHEEASDRDDRARAFRLHQPGLGGSTVLSQAGGYLTLAGERRPRGHGVVGPYGFDLHSFAMTDAASAVRKLLGKESTALERGTLIDIHRRFSKLWCADGGPGGAL